jgi:hypothetical protein
MAEPEPDTDSWEEPPRTLGDQRTEKLVNALAYGLVKCKKDERELARQMCVSEYVMKNRSRSPKVKQLVAEEVQVRALYMVAQKLDNIAKLADTKQWAFNALCKIATIIPVGGISITSNTLIDARVSGSTASVQASARQFWERVQQARAPMELIEGTAVEPAPSTE